jgi:hypothetical protein
MLQHGLKKKTMKIDNVKHYQFFYSVFEAYVVKQNGTEVHFEKQNALYIVVWRAFRFSKCISTYF